MKVIYFITIFLLACTVQAQDSLVTKIASQHYQIINFENNHFSGEGIRNLTETIAQHKYVLIGEDHLNNEVLDFTSYLTNHINFDNYITETDQFTIDILKKDCEKNREYQSIVSNSNGKFSFFSFDKDHDLLDYFFQNNKTVIGLDQVYYNSDAVIFQELIKRTSNPLAKAKYEALLKESTARWDRYKKEVNQSPLEDGSNRPYLFSNDLGKNLMQLQKLELSDYEYRAINKLKISNEIYVLENNEKEAESNFLRTSSMKENFLENLDKIKGKRNLFKFGANHAARDKSLLQNSSDIGNLASSLAGSEKEKSLHIAIIQKSGKTGSFFSDSNDAEYVLFLRPFYRLVNKENQWLLFDLTKINEEIKKQKTSVKSSTLKNLLSGYDYLIIIPKVTAQKIVV
ncbi:hypothetical protein [Chryseobacterium paridis]|uniref:Erythromycin esterase family protein n=1 Tax=Chryseobacterium paridis TaxID=2800328 RepID=A0ABS1FT96_9FLAO|nr:hypothetical protein [Chryseobacterium paridis]MBK1895647.1 hypothetical protein [Chryseobacterium paridis]